jgi:hypothetical protein
MNSIHHRRIFNWLDMLACDCQTRGFTVRGPNLTRRYGTKEIRLVVTKPDVPTLTVRITDVNSRFSIDVFVNDVSFPVISCNPQSKSFSGRKDWAIIRHQVPHSDILLLLREAEYADTLSGYFQG